MVPEESNLSYYSVTRGGKALYTYSNGDQETERLALLCLEMAPSHHRWYLQTVSKTTVGYLFDDGHVYFAIVMKDGDCNTVEILKFLHQLRDNFRKTTPIHRSLSVQQQRIHPIDYRLGMSLEKVNSLPPYLGRIEASPFNRQFEGSFSMEAPLLGISRQEKEANKYHSIAMTMEQEACSSISSVGETEVKSRSDSFEIEIPTRKSHESPGFRWKWFRLIGVVIAMEAALGVGLVIVWLHL